MLKIGERQTLIVVKRVDFGVYLAESIGNEKDKEKVLLPAKQVAEGLTTGDSIDVFLYKDSEDRLISTTNDPLLHMGEVALLRVVAVSKIGAFLDWGLEKDLFLPFKEQTYRVQEGDEVLASLYVDKSGRLCATMNVYENLRSDSTYIKDMPVSGRVYLVSERFGAFVAVDDQYSALVPRKDMYGKAEELKAGDRIIARVSKVMEDGRLQLAVRDKGYMQREDDAETIMKLIESYDGSLPFTDKASPEVIFHETKMSKAQFKRAIGKLYKERRIEICEKSIKKI